MIIIAVIMLIYYYCCHYYFIQNTLWYWTECVLRSWKRSNGIIAVAHITLTAVWKKRNVHVSRHTSQIKTSEHIIRWKYVIRLDQDITLANNQLLYTTSNICKYICTLSYRCTLAMYEAEHTEAPPIHSNLLLLRNRQTLIKTVNFNKRTHLNSASTLTAMHNVNKFCSSYI